MSVFDAAGGERALRVEQLAHVVVGVISPPHAHPGVRVLPQVLPRPPESVETAVRLTVRPPLRAPFFAVAVDHLAAIVRPDHLVDEIEQGLVHRCRFGVVGVRFGSTCCFLEVGRQCACRGGLHPFVQLGCQGFLELRLRDGGEFFADASVHAVLDQRLQTLWQLVCRRVFRCVADCLVARTERRDIFERWKVVVGRGFVG